MRINHCGEICAQALYQGQALTARDKSHQEAFEHAAYEETEHLAWTKSRVKELGGHISVLNPLFYFGSLAIGVTAGIFGDKWNLGFLAETERQVESHLTHHLEQIPADDVKSKAILSQMKEDEIKHAHMAVEYGGVAELPLPVKLMMKAMSKVMTKTTYYL
jgi:ubiquinone biosynthesis monooxygenase Coq7